MQPPLILLVLTLSLNNALGYSILRLNCTRPNEEYQCGSACQTTCNNLGVTCPIVNIRCNDACYCIQGYARIGGDNGKCIPQNQCPGYVSCNRPNEIFSCESDCEQRCDNESNCNNAPQSQGRCSNPGCACKPGFARDGGNNCILGTDC